MLKYIPTGQIFSNRLEAKLKLGHANFNKIIKKHPELIVFIKSEEYNG